MWVVKLGGSLMTSNQLQAWLDYLDEHGKGRVVIVPGGGLFADQIRIAQKQWVFNDKAAHHMALLAMEQYAFYCQSLLPELQMVDELEQAKDLLKQNKLVIFMPQKVISPIDTLVEDWSLTSDSIAVILSEMLQADGLILVKSLEQISDSESIDDLSKSGIVDKSMPDFCRSYNGEVHCLVVKDFPRFKRILNG